MNQTKIKQKSEHTFLIYFISLLLFVVLRILVAENLLNFTSNKTLQTVIFSLLSQSVLMCALPLLLYMLLTKNTVKDTLRHIGFKKTSIKIVLISTIFGVLAFVFNMYVSNFFNEFWGIFGYRSVGGVGVGTNYTAVNFIFDILLVAVLPAFCEEFLHRGILLNGAKKIGVKQAIIYSSLLFGLVHLNIEQMFYATLLGGFLAVITLVTGNILPAMIIHFVNNAIVVYLRGARAFGWMGGNYATNINGFFKWLGPFLSMIFAAAMFLFVLYLMLKLIFVLFKDTVYSVKTNEDQVFNVNNLNKKVEINNINTANSQNHLDYGNMKSIIDIMIPKSTGDKISKTDKTFLIASLFLGTMVTVFTFVWGLL